jgi:hypothetical protein
MQARLDSAGAMAKPILAMMMQQSLGMNVAEWDVAKKVAAANRRLDVAGTSVAPTRAWRQHHHQTRQLDQTSTPQLGS